MVAELQGAGNGLDDYHRRILELLTELQQKYHFGKILPFRVVFWVRARYIQYTRPFSTYQSITIQLVQKKTPKSSKQIFYIVFIQYCSIICF